MPRIALLLSTLVWGATFPATKAALEQIPPFSFLLLRFLLGLLLVLAVVLAMGKGWPFGRARFRHAAIASAWLFLGYTLQTVGLSYTTASNSAFITALYVVLVPLFLRRFDRMVWLSSGLAVAGLWLLIDPLVALNLGDLMTLGCAAAFAAHIACLESYTREGDSLSLFLWQLLLTTLALVPFAVFEAPEVPRLTANAVLLVALFVTGVLATGAFAVQIWAQRHLPAQRVALIYALEPAYAAWLAWYFLGEQLAFNGWVGSGLIVAAVLMGTLSGGAPSGRQPEASGSAV